MSGSSPSQGPQGTLGASRPRDDSLRRVLSTDQDRWITLQLNLAKGMAWASLFSLLLGTGWLAADHLGVFDTEPGCYQLSADAPDYKERLAEFEAEGLRPCPPAGAAEPSRPGADMGWLANLLALILVVVSPLTLARNLFLVRRYKGYLKDHESFLRKYGG